jgi:hypothetical protein
MLWIPDYSPVHPRHRARGLRDLLAGKRVFGPLGSVGCGCCGGGSVTLVFTGCNSLPVQGLPVNVWTSPAETDLLFSGTTNALGQLVGPISGSGTIFVDTQTGNTGSPVWSRFASLPKTTISATAGGTTTISLGSAASGFACVGCCAVPLKTTLFLTDSMYGPTTIAFNDGILIWTGSPPAGTTSPGCGGCPPGAGSIQYIWSCEPGIDAVVFAGGTQSTPFFCPGGFDPEFLNCPMATTSVTCLTPTQAFQFMGTLSLSEACSIGGEPAGNPSTLYCSTPTFTVTE